jgi:hypothetical protein
LIFFGVFSYKKKITVGLVILDVQVFKLRKTSGKRLS